MKTLLALTLLATGIVSGCAATNYQTRRAQEAQANAAAYNAMTPEQRFEHDYPDLEERRLIAEVIRSDQQIAEARKDDAVFNACVPSGDPGCLSRLNIYRTYIVTMEDVRARRLDQLQAYRKGRDGAMPNRQSRIAGALQGFNARRNAQTRTHCEKSYRGGYDCTSE